MPALPCVRIRPMHPAASKSPALMGLVPVSCYLRKLAFRYYIFSHFLGDSTLQDFLQP